MLCDICGKNPATVHLTEIIDDQMTELHLCEKCAREKSTQMEQQFGLADLLAGLTEFGTPKEEKEVITIKCPNCGMGFDDFKKIGRLGCSECYPTFKRYLGPLLKRIHGSNQHVGKSPLKIAKGVIRKLAGLDEMRRKLQVVIEREEFEEAARIRDQIKELEKKESRQGKDNHEA